MPFQSYKQQKFMFAKHPKIAKEWAEKYGTVSKRKKNIKHKMISGVTNIADKAAYLYGKSKEGSSLREFIKSVNKAKATNSLAYKKTIEKLGNIAKSGGSLGAAKLSPVIAGGVLAGATLAGAAAIGLASRKTNRAIAKYSQETNKAQDELTKLIKSRRK